MVCFKRVDRPKVCFNFLYSIPLFYIYHSVVYTLILIPFPCDLARIML